MIYTRDSEREKNRNMSKITLTLCIVASALKISFLSYEEEILMETQLYSVLLLNLKVEVSKGRALERLLVVRLFVKT